MEHEGHPASDPTIQCPLDIAALVTMQQVLEGCQRLTDGEAREASADGSAPRWQAAAPYNRLGRI